MSPDRALRELPRGGAAEGGFTLVEILVAAAVMGVIATTVLGGLLYGMAEARRGHLRAAAAIWAQAELDYFRLRGYAFLADDVAAGTRTLTQTTGYTSYVDVAEPRLPAGFDRAVIKADDIPGLPLRKLTITLYETPTSPPYTILSTYVANFTYATAP